MSQTYTQEEKDKLKILYKEHGTKGIDKIAAEMGKSVPSIRSVLVISGQYVPAEKKVTGKNKGPTKKNLIAELCAVTGLNHKGLDPASKDCIQELMQYIKDLKGENGQI